MILLEKALNGAQIDIMGETKKILLGQTKNVLDLTGLIKGMMALDGIGLYKIEKEPHRSTVEIDLGIDLYNMENWD